MSGSHEGFWFFDVGGVAWTFGLQDALTSAIGDAGPDLDAIHRARALWRAGKPAEADACLSEVVDAGAIEHPEAALVRVPLLAWGKHDTEKAGLLLDRALSQVPAGVRASLGITIPLTYALLNATAGRPSLAADILAGGRGSIDALLAAHPEVRYHRARYQVAGGDLDAAADTLKGVFSDEPTYMVRAYTDPALVRSDGAFVPVLKRLTRDLVGAARKEEGPAAGRGAPDAYTALARAASAAEQSAGRELRAQASRQLRSVREFVAALPETLPVRLGEAQGSAPPAEVVGQVAKLLDEDELDEALEILGEIRAVLPLATKMALIRYLVRLVKALEGAQTAIERRVARGADGERTYLEKMAALHNRYEALVDPIRSLPPSLGPALAERAREVWRKTEAIQADWITVQQGALGVTHVVPPTLARPESRGNFSVIKVRVEDRGGDPAVAVPVIWRVLSGPARPTNSEEFLGDQWALSLSGGVAYLPIEFGDTQGGGEIEVEPLGGDAVQFPYTVGE